MENDEVLTKVLENCGFDAGHEPVLVREVLEGFDVFRNRSGLRLFDGTFGRGGHFRAIHALLGDAIAESVVIDQDAVAIECAHRDFSTLVQSGRMKVERANFSEFSEASLGQFDMMILDLGVSSPQLDTPERGFSFYNDGPLDMRMNQEQSLTAEFILNTSSEEDLNRMFRELGEVHRPFRVSRAAVHDRKIKAYKTTREFASLVERVDGWRQKGVHPATQYFMALRLAVNNELGVVADAIPKMMSALKKDGRLAVISFHSLEDRIVKNLFRAPDADGKPVNKKVIVATQDECKRNPRSRSAKLRIFQRGVQDERPSRKTF